jgi:hypothetical protein
VAVISGRITLISSGSSTVDPTRSTNITLSIRRSASPGGAGLVFLGTSLAISALIAKAVQRPTMKFVPTKTAEQLDLQALHRVRELAISVQ